MESNTNVPLRRLNRKCSLLNWKRDKTFNQKLRKYIGFFFKVKGSIFCWNTYQEVEIISHCWYWQTEYSELRLETLDGHHNIRVWQGHPKVDRNPGHHTPLKVRCVRKRYEYFWCFWRILQMKRIWSLFNVSLKVFISNFGVNLK